MTPNVLSVKYDVFISHASEDKPYVGPLTKALDAAGVSVWYDSLILEWGDDLRPMIDSGLLNCRYGIVVLSKAFLGKKKWTEHELNGLFAREQAGKKLVLPIWNGIVRDDLLQYSPALADRLAKISESDSYDDIVNSLLGMLGRPVPEQNVQTLASTPAGPKLSEPAQPARREIAKLRRAPGPPQDGEDLSPREIELLWNAAKDSRGEILHSRTFEGEGIRTNGRHFLRDPSPPNSSAKPSNTARSTAPTGRKGFNIPRNWAVASHGFVDHAAFGRRVISLTRIFRGSRVLLADMRCKRLVALLLVMRLHLVN